MRSPRFRIWAANLRARSSTCQEGIRSTDVPLRSPTPHRRGAETHTRVELADVVGEAVDAARVVEPNRPITVELDQAIVIGDRDRLRQIVDNLLANVRAHTGPETPVRVDLSRVDGHAEIASPTPAPG